MNQILFAVIVIAAAVVFSTGCAMVKYPTEHGMATYVRWGDQEIEGLRANRQTGEFAIDRQGSDAKALEVMAETIRSLATP